MVLILYEFMDKVEDKLMNLWISLRIKKGFVCITYSITVQIFGERRLYLSPFVNHAFGKVGRIVERVALAGLPENRAKKGVESYSPFPRPSPQNMFMKNWPFSLKISPFPQIHGPYY